jgi:hypothetical protein
MKNKWSKEEIKYLIENYHKVGANGISKYLDRSINTVRIKASYYNLTYEKIDEKYSENNFIKLVNESISYKEILKKLNLTYTGNNTKTIKKYIEKYNININHFVSTKNDKNKIELCDILIESSTYSSTSDLKNRLYKEGLKQRFCEICGQNEEWQGKKMSLILDHKNGVNNDNRIENLRIVCPNCNATLPTHCGKNKGKRNKRKEEYGYSINDDIDFRKIKTKEIIEKQYKMRKVKDRPDIETLKNEVNKNGYSATGRKYGVSDNTIRKWLK